MAYLPTACITAHPSFRGPFFFTDCDATYQRPHLLLDLLSRMHRPPLLSRGCFFCSYADAIPFYDVRHRSPLLSRGVFFFTDCATTYCPPLLFFLLSRMHRPPLLSRNCFFVAAPMPYLFTTCVTAHPLLSTGFFNTDCDATYCPPLLRRHCPPLLLRGGFFTSFWPTPSFEGFCSYAHPCHTFLRRASPPTPPFEVFFLNTDLPMT